MVIVMVCVSQYLLIKLRSREWEINDDIREYHKTYYVGDHVFPLLKEYETFNVNSDGVIVPWNYDSD